MAYPSALDNLLATIADGTAIVNEAHTIPASGPYTIQLGSAWQTIPHGAFRLPAPGTFTAVAATVPGGQLTAGVYKYTLTFMSPYGDTTVSTEVSVTLSGGQNAVHLTSIPLASVGTNPCVGRGIWRTAVGGASASEALVTRILDNTTTEYYDILADAARTTAQPSTNGSGQALVTISGYTEVAASPAALQFVVDYSTGTTGGTLTFNSANANASIQVSYTGGTLVTAALLNSLITSINNIETTLGINPQGSSADVVTRLAPNTTTNTPLIPARLDATAAGTGGIQLDQSVATWGEFDRAGHNIFKNITAKGNRQYLIIVTFTQFSSVLDVVYDIGVSATSATPTTTTTGKNTGDAYSSTDGLYAAKNGIQHNVCMVYTTGVLSAGVHKVCPMMALSATTGFAYTANMQMVIVEL